MITDLSSPGEVSRTDTFQFAGEDDLFRHIGKDQRFLRTGSPHDKQSWHRLSRPGVSHLQAETKEHQSTTSFPTSTASIQSRILISDTADLALLIMFFFAMMLFFGPFFCCCCRTGEENDQVGQRQSQNRPQQQDPIQFPHEGEGIQSTSIRIIPRRRILDDAVEQQELGRVLQESRKEYIKSFLCTTEVSSELVVEEQKRTADVIEESLNSTSQKNDSNICCSICLDEYAPGDLVSRAKKASACHHLFHEHCITGWLMNHDDCPCCRTSYFQ